jgi:hypothetical protein
VCALPGDGYSAARPFRQFFGRLIIPLLLFPLLRGIEAQKMMVNSPNHTSVHVPVGPMGVPLTGTFPARGGSER